MLPESLIDLSDFHTDDWRRIIDLALQIKKDPKAYFGRCEGKILATLFYEPSTRTQMSFQTAMLRLGGQTIGFDNPMNSSVAKGENLRDTIKIISGYADILVIRHPSEGAAKAAALNADCPVINAGDGGHLHPTQTLTDLVTLTEEKGRLDHLVIGLCGDLKYGRTVHSLIKTLAPFDNKFVLISTKDLCVPQYIRDILDSNGCQYKEVYSLEEAISSLDVLYMTRIQKERFASVEEYEAQKDVYILDAEKLSRAKGTMKILHPLPRVDEIDVAVDDDSRAVYFKQAVNGVYARMALILTLLDAKEKAPLSFAKEIKTAKCRNPKCITQTETYLPRYFKESSDMLVCDYCDERFLI